MKFISTGL